MQSCTTSKNNKSRMVRSFCIPVRLIPFVSPFSFFFFFLTLFFCSLLLPFSNFSSFFSFFSFLFSFSFSFPLPFSFSIYFYFYFSSCFSYSSAFFFFLVFLPFPFFLREGSFPQRQNKDKSMLNGIKNILRVHIITLKATQIWTSDSNYSYHIFISVILIVLSHRVFFPEIHVLSWIQPKSIDPKSYQCLNRSEINFIACYQLI